MKTNRFLTILLAMVMTIVMLSGCGTNNGEEAKNDVNSTTNNSEEAKNDVNSTTNNSEQSPNTTQEKNTVSTDNSNIISDVIVIEGVEYTFPTAAKSLLDNGWSDAFDTMKEKLKPGEGALYSCSLKHNEEKKIGGVGFFNNGTSEATLDKCDIIHVKLFGKTMFESEKTCSFILPGGITEKSTRDEVVNTYGLEKDENSNEYFSISDTYDENKPDMKSSVMYIARKTGDVPYTYTFYFNSDNTIEYVTIESSNYGSKAVIDSFGN